MLAFTIAAQSVASPTSAFTAGDRCAASRGNVADRDLRCRQADISADEPGGRLRE